MLDSMVFAVSVADTFLSGSSVTNFADVNKPSEQKKQTFFFVIEVAAK